MKVSRLENFVMAGLTLLGLGDALLLIIGKGAFGVLADAAHGERAVGMLPGFAIGFIITIGLAAIGFLMAMILGPIWLARVKASAVGWLGLAGALLMAVAVMFFYAVVILLRVPYNHLISQVLMGVGAGFVLIVSFMRSKEWFPKASLVMTLIFAVGLGVYTAGHMLRFSLSSSDLLEMLMSGSYMMLAGLVVMAIMHSISRYQRVNTSEFDYNADSKPILVAGTGPVGSPNGGGVTYGTV